MNRQLHISDFNNHSTFMSTDQSSLAFGLWVLSALFRFNDLILLFMFSTLLLLFYKRGYISLSLVLFLMATQCELKPFSMTWCWLRSTHGFLVISALVRHTKTIRVDAGLSCLITASLKVHRQFWSLVIAESWSEIRVPSAGRAVARINTGHSGVTL